MKDIDFFKDIVGGSLKAIQEDLEKYLGGQDFVGKEKKDDEEDSKPISILELFTLPFTSFFKILGINLGKKKEAKPEYSKFKYKNDLEKITESLKSNTKEAYTLFKDENGLPTESATLSLHK
jgi:hypothetical protein